MTFAHRSDVHGEECGYGGGKYVGEFKNDKWNGHGTFTCAHYKYVGEYKNGKIHGQGTFSRHDGTIIHSGEWENDKPKKEDVPKNVS